MASLPGPVPPPAPPPDAAEPPRPSALSPTRRGGGGTTPVTFSPSLSVAPPRLGPPLPSPSRRLPASSSSFSSTDEPRTLAVRKHLSSPMPPIDTGGVEEVRIKAFSSLSPPAIGSAIGSATAASAATAAGGSPDFAAGDYISAIVPSPDTGASELVVGKVLAIHPNGIEVMIQYSKGDALFETLVEATKLSARPVPLTRRRLTRLVHMPSNDSLHSVESEVRPFDPSDLESPKLRKDASSPRFRHSPLSKDKKRVGSGSKELLVQVAANNVVANSDSSAQSRKSSSLTVPSALDLNASAQQLASPPSAGASLVPMSPRKDSLNSLGSGIVSAFDSSMDLKALGAASPGSPSLDRHMLLTGAAAGMAGAPVGSSPTRSQSHLGSFGSFDFQGITPPKQSPGRTGTSPDRGPQSSTLSRHSSSMLGFKSTPPEASSRLISEDRASQQVREPLALAHGNTDFQGMIPSRRSNLSSSSSPNLSSLGELKSGSSTPQLLQLEGYPLTPSLDVRALAFSPKSEAKHVVRTSIQEPSVAAIKEEHRKHSVDSAGSLDRPRAASSATNPEDTVNAATAAAAWHVGMRRVVTEPISLAQLSGERKDTDGSEEHGASLQRPGHVSSPNSPVHKNRGDLFPIDDSAEGEAMTSPSLPPLAVRQAVSESLPSVPLPVMRSHSVSAPQGHSQASDDVLPSPMSPPPLPTRASESARRARKAGFAFSSFDATVRAFKQKLFRRPSSSSAKSDAGGVSALSSSSSASALALQQQQLQQQQTTSPTYGQHRGSVSSTLDHPSSPVSTPPLPEDRRTVASVSVGSRVVSTEGGDADEDDDAVSAQSESDDVPDTAPLRTLVQLVAECGSDEPANALLFSSPDLGDGAVLGNAILDAYESSTGSVGVFLVLERWLTEFGGFERLQLCSPAVLGRIRKLLATIANEGKTREEEEEDDGAEDSSLASVDGSSANDTVVLAKSADGEDASSDYSDVPVRAAELLRGLAAVAVEDVDMGGTPQLRSTRSFKLPPASKDDRTAGNVLRRVSSAPALFTASMQIPASRLRAQSALPSRAVTQPAVDEDEEAIMQMLALVVVDEVTDASIYMDEAAHPSLRDTEVDDFSSPTSRKSSDASTGLSPRHTHRGSLTTRRRSTNQSFSSWGNFSMGNSIMSDVGESLAKEAKIASLPPLLHRKDVWRFPAVFVAEQLTQTMCRGAYNLITRVQLRTASGRKHSAPVQRLVRFFEVLSYWPLAEILRDPKRRASERIDVYGFFVTLATCCRQLGNYHAVFALTGALTSPLLAWVQEIAHRRDKQALSLLKRVVRSDNNYRVYLADLTKCSPDMPHVPYLGLLNRTMLVLESDAPVFVGDAVNFLRCRKIWTVTGEFLSGHKEGAKDEAIVVHPSVRRALAASMSRTRLDYNELSEMSAKAKAGFLKSVAQRAFHQARQLGHQVLREPPF